MYDIHIHYELWHWLKSLKNHSNTLANSMTTYLYQQFTKKNCQRCNAHQNRQNLYMNDAKNRHSDNVSPKSSTEVQFHTSCFFIIIHADHFLPWIIYYFHTWRDLIQVTTKKDLLQLNIIWIQNMVLWQLANILYKRIEWILLNNHHANQSNLAWVNLCTVSQHLNSWV